MKEFDGRGLFEKMSIDALIRMLIEDLPSDGVLHTARYAITQQFVNRILNISRSRVLDFDDKKSASDWREEWYGRKPLPKKEEAPYVKECKKRNLNKSVVIDILINRVISDISNDDITFKEKYAYVEKLVEQVVAISETQGYEFTEKSGAMDLHYKLKRAEHEPDIQGE